MKRILIRYGLLLLYVLGMGIYFFPKGQSLTEGEGLRWLLTVLGGVLVVVILVGLQYYRIRRRNTFNQNHKQ